MNNHPYSNLNNYQLWRRAISRLPTHLVDPVVNPRFKLDKNTKVSTAGSCFAQHISRRISEIGFNYFVPESGGTLTPAEKKKRNFGIFSARYGNIYTAAQLNKLFDEVYKKFHPIEKAWQRPDGRFIDPYRQQVEPDGYESDEAVAAARQGHLEFVQAVFEDSDVFIFTLGLTEAWRSKRDGAVFPLAPGVVGGNFNGEQFEFVNFTVDQVADDMRVFLKNLKEVNNNIKVLLTVSPVPLIATYENRNVLTSTTYSKSVLRVVAEMMILEFDWVDYFPSYEIITGNYAGGLYYKDDMREVNNLGVAHAMRCFVDNYVEGKTRPAERSSASALASTDLSTQSSEVCDESVIDAVKHGTLEFEAHAICVNAGQKSEGMNLENCFVPTGVFAGSTAAEFLQASIPMAADFYHEDYANFLRLMNHPFFLHRKLWEWIYIITKLRNAGVVFNGARGLCFGAGTEPLPAIFASLGCNITATDAPIDVVSEGWVNSNQHAAGLPQLQRPDIIDNEKFSEMVTFEPCDMRAIASDLKSFDFCWSSSCLEHLGSLRNGADFIINSVEKTLKIGGVACHTTELNLSSNDETFESENISLFRRCDLESLAAEVRARGHEIAPLVIKIGTSPIDYIVDLPPYSSGWPHLKLKHCGYVLTSVGVVIRRGAGG